MAKVLSSETAPRASFAQLVCQEENLIRLLHDKIFLMVNEAAVALQKYVNVLVGSLETPTGTYLIECLPLESCSSINSAFILLPLVDILRQLGTKQKKFCIAFNGWCSLYVSCS